MKNEECIIINYSLKKRNSHIIKYFTLVFQNSLCILNICLSVLMYNMALQDSFHLLYKLPDTEIS